MAAARSSSPSFSFLYLRFCADESELFRLMAALSSGALRLLGPKAASRPVSRHGRVSVSPNDNPGLHMPALQCAVLENGDQLVFGPVKHV